MKETMINVGQLGSVTNAASVSFQVLKGGIGQVVVCCNKQMSQEKTALSHSCPDADRLVMQDLDAQELLFRNARSFVRKKIAPHTAFLLFLSIFTFTVYPKLNLALVEFIALGVLIALCTATSYAQTCLWGACERELSQQCRRVKKLKVYQALGVGSFFFEQASNKKLDGVTGIKKTHGSQFTDFK